MKTNSTVSKNAVRSLPLALRVMSWVVILTQFLCPCVNQVSAAVVARTEGPVNETSAIGSQPAPRETAQTSQINTTVPPVNPPPSRPNFSASPTDKEIYRARVFGEPLTRLSKASTAEENRALADALTAFMDRTSNEDVGSPLRFLEQYPESTWRASLLLNLGILYRKTGYFRSALAAWEEAWNLAKHETEARAKAMADLAFGELVELNARLGRYDKLELLFIEIAGRGIWGPATEKVTGAREGLWLMRNRPEVAFRCGPMALDRIRAARNPADAYDQKIRESCSTTNGMSLVQVCGLANELKMNYQMAKRQPGSQVIVPGVVHWKAGHYAAVTRETNGLYLIQDPTFGDDIWITGAALDEESSGYWLIEAQELSQGWQAVSQAEGEQVWGKGATSANDPRRTKECDHKTSPCGGGSAMAQYTFHTMLVSLNIVDTPVGYVPPRGPAVPFRVTYNQREAFQPANFPHSNLGAKWTFGWLAYIVDDPQVGQNTRTYHAMGGGWEYYTYDWSGNGTVFLTTSENRSHLVRTSSSSYERRLPDGSRQIFSQSDGATVYPRRIFMTKMADPSGNAVTLSYDEDFRLTSIQDAIGQVTTFSYELAADDMKVTKVIDPFGRYATFDYTQISNAWRLTKITDVVGITSEFTYGTNDFITSLKTPYGTTTFEMGESGRTRWLQATDPLGQKEHLRYQDTSSLPQNAAACPPGWDNNWMSYRNSLYWDKRAMQLDGTNDLTTAKIFHWLHSTLGETSGLLENEKAPLEERVWYSYYGQSSTQIEGTNGRPKQIGRVLDDGTSQIVTFEYNEIGNITKVTDPTNRQTRFVYSTNLVDLLEVRQVVGSTNELLASFTYGTNHLPLIAVDAAGQTNRFAYNAYGQLTAITNALNEVVTLSYNSSGFLTNITGALPGATTSFTYDGTNRVKTITDSEGYTVTFEYDALNRPTRIGYPDNTTNQIVYKYLDPILYKDRRGHWTQTIYDPLRRVVVIQDALNRVTTFDWCSCGSLSSITDPMGRVTSWIRDLQGRVTNKVYPDQSTVAYNYETRTSRLKEVIDAKNQITRYEYYPDNNLKKVIYTNSPVITPTVMFTYHSNYNRLLTMVDGIGTNTYSYYAVSNTVLGAGALQSIDGPLTNDTVSYAYDELGRVKSGGINGVEQRVTYDALGRVTVVTNALGSFTNANVSNTFRLSSVAYPNGQTTTFSYYGNTNDQRLETIWHKTPGGATISKFDYAYDPDGQIKTWTQQADAGTPKTHVFDYDPVDQLLGATVRSNGIAGAILKRYIYDYDTGGNRTSEQTDLGVSTATHNNLNQLTGVSASTGPVKWAGRLSEAGTVQVAGLAATMGIQNTSFTAYASASLGTNNVQVRATDYSNNSRTNTYQIVVTNNGLAKTLSYDIKGNLTNAVTANSTNRYEWDGTDRLIKITQLSSGPQLVSEFTYDGLGRRVRIIEKTNGVVQSDKRFLWCETELCEERDSTGAAVTKRFFGQGEEISGTAYFFTRDHLGSIREMTDSGGAIQARYEFDPYGRRTKVSGTLDSDFAFTGHYYHQASGLHLAPYRAYDTETGRWISRDPIAEDGGVNLYLYALSDPIGLVDPTGLSPEDVPRIYETIQKSGQEMTANGQRHTFGPLNNILISLQIRPDYKECVSQETYVRSALQQQKYQDVWTFTPVLNRSRTHQSGVATSSNPYDPVIYYDPWFANLTYQVPSRWMVPPNLKRNAPPERLRCP